MGPQSCESLNFGNSGLPFGSPETKYHLDVAPVESCRKYYKGKGGGFPSPGRGESYESKVARGSS
jgi:hypothetical protein